MQPAAWTSSFCEQLLFLLCLCVCHLHLTQTINLNGNNIISEYDQFIKKYEKHYQHQSNEYWKRFKVFKESLNISSQLNKLHQQQNETVYGVTKFSDLSPQEFKKLYLEDLKNPGLLFKREKKTPLENIKNLKVPLRVDWRTSGIVSQVKNQRACGGCWAFSTVETIESMYSKETGVTVPDLAVQEVIDCSTTNDGCSGGDTCAALTWLQSGIPVYKDSAYHLTDKDQLCHMSAESTVSPIYVVNHTCSSYVGNEDLMVNLLATVGPLSVTVDASTWNNYVKGVIQYHCSDFNNHAVQVVGYDLTGDVPYFIVRNSWGKDFGIDGYLHVKIGNNLCGIAKRVSTVYVKA